MKKLFLLINILFLITNCFSCDDSSDVLTSISPNEQIIISYVSKATFGEPDIHLMNLDGTDEKNLTNSTIGEWDPQFSPDGTKIIFYSVANGDYEIFIINVDGTNLQRLTNSP